MRKASKFTIFTLILILVLSVSSLGLVFADSLSNINSQIKDKQEQLQEGQEKSKELSDQVKALESSITQTEKELKAIDDEISSTQTKIDKVTAELNKVEEEMEQQNEDLDARLRTMYKNGDIGLLQVILSSESFTDLIANLEMVKTIHNTDVEVLETMKEQQKIIAEQQKELQELQDQIEAKRIAQAEKQKSLESDKYEVAQAKGSVDADNAEIVEQIQSLEADAAQVGRDLPNLQDPNKEYVGGTMQWPVAGYYSISSPYGYRTHPISGQRSFHTGIDIPAPAGTSILAAQSGTVIFAGSKGSYGNTVMIDHGNGISTLYAHCSSINVSTGQNVSKGQRVAGVGTTGSSTGNHLHFEVRINGAHTNPIGWV